MKKLWKKPELVVLVRNRPEEALLIGCKTTVIDGPTTVKSGCYGDSPCNVVCNVLAST